MDSGIYFCMVSMSTVGYGDLSPSRPETRVMTVALILIGILVVFTRLSTIVSYLTRPIVTWGQRWVRRRFPKRVAHRMRAGWVFYCQNMLPSLVLNVLLQLASAAIYSATEQWDYGTALYHVIITATTVGYGDTHLAPNDSSRGWAAFHILVL